MALKFNGTVGSKARTTTGLPTWEAFTVVGVSRPDSVAAGNKTILQGGVDTTTSPGFVIIYSGTNIQLYDYSGALKGTSGLVASVTEHYGWAVVSAGGGTTANGARMYTRKLSDKTTATDLKQGAWYNAVHTGTLPAFNFGDTHYSEALNGTVESVMVFDRVLTQAEIEQCWSRRVPSSRPTRWWPMHADTLANAYRDFMGVDNLATVGTAPTVASGGPIPWGGQSIIAPTIAGGAAIALNADILVESSLSAGALNGLAAVLSAVLTTAGS